MPHPVTYKSIFCGLMLLVVFSSAALAAEQNKNGVLKGSVTDSTGQPLENYIIILANTRMSMIDQTIYSGNSPFEAPIVKACQWQAIITDYSGDTVRIIDYDTKPGSFRIDWDQKDNNGRHMEDGVYFISFDSPINKFFLGSWAIWNYSEPGVAMPLLFKRISKPEFIIDDLIASSDTLNIFYRYIMHSVQVGSPYDLFCFKEGYQKELQKIELRPGDTTRVDFILKPE